MNTATTILPGAAATGSGSEHPALRLHAISKRFGPLVANDQISLDLGQGEVLALLGENGAGKSTLVSILFGHYVADSGWIEVNGQPLPAGQPAAALRAGIGMVHQHFTLADNLSVLDNVMLGTESLWRPFSRRTDTRQKLLQTAQRFGLQVDPQARVAELSVGERQRVEILKVLVRGARILILDEPTAVLTLQESESLFATLAQMVAQGLSVIFISHKLDEVLRVSDRIAVLRAGRLVATLQAAKASSEELALAMVGRTVATARRSQHAPTPVPAKPVLQLQSATVRRLAAERGAANRARSTGSGQGSGEGSSKSLGQSLGKSLGTSSARPLLDAVTLQVHAGEVVSIAGVSGNGQATLAALLFGEQGLHSGSLLLQGQPLPARAAAFVQAGVARVPDDRHQMGLVGDLTLWENAVLERYRQADFSRLGWIKRSAAMAWTAGLLQRFDVRGTQGQGLATAARQLSGGNMQKLILARVLDRAGVTAMPTATVTPGAPPLLIVANQPTWGLDVGATAYVHQQLLDAAAAGSAVLVISEDLDEVFALADRIAVMHEGRLSPALPRADWSLQRIGLAMAGNAGVPDADSDADAEADADLDADADADADSAQRRDGAAKTAAGHAQV